ncbi:MAG: hypothetical protein J7502_01115 [Flavisolibacter sp.]|nr:hypothetical protein [Flavisolibacter sp.]
MRKTFRLLPFILSIALITTIVSCSKEGPAGPAGAAGPAGPQGPSGPAGPAGPAGTANVIYSDWLDVAFTPLKDTQTNGTIDTVAWTGRINAAKLDLNILNKGEIKVYLNAGNSTSPFVAPLPLTDLVYNYLFIRSMNPYFSVGRIDLLSTDDGSTETFQGAKYYQYRYILIPGGTTARSAINWNDYKQVQKYLGLKD